MLDFDVITGILVAVALVLLIRFVFPLYKDRSSIYKDVKAGVAFIWICISRGQN